MTEHSALTGSSLHEPKGASAASSNTVMTANGSGGTSWNKVGTSNLDSSSIFDANGLIITVSIADVSTSGSIYVAMPVACTVSRIDTVLEGAITGADSIITFRNNAGTSMGTITVGYSGSAAGDVDTLSPSSNNTFTAGQRMKIDTDGGSTGTVALRITILVTRTA